MFSSSYHHHHCSLEMDFLHNNPWRHRARTHPVFELVSCASQHRQYHPECHTRFPKRRDENCVGDSPRAIETEHSIWEDTTIHRRPVGNDMCCSMVPSVHPIINFPLDTRVPTRVRSHPRDRRNGGRAIWR